MTHKIRTILDLKNYLNSSDGPTLVVTDIDNTVLKAPSHFGSEAWYDERIVDLIRKGMEEEPATLRVNLEWEQIQQQINPVPVETGTIDFLTELQCLPHVRLIALTTRRPEIAELTELQLEKYGFSFQSGCPSQAVIHIDPQSQYRGGVLYVGPLNHKGFALKELLAQLGWTPKKIIFVDDRPHQLASVLESVGNEIQTQVFQYLAPGSSLGLGDLSLSLDSALEGDEDVDREQQRQRRKK
jgi:hypothetical protein